MKGTHISTKQNSDSKDINSFKIERYKYILGEIHTLNENIQKYLVLFQTLATAIIGSGIGIFVVWKSLNINAETARIAIQGAVGLLVLVALFIITSVLANIFAWLDYRKEEVELLNEAVEINFRKSPTWRNFWRWSETYILLFIIVSVIFICFFVEYKILPLVK